MSVMEPEKIPLIGPLLKLLDGEGINYGGVLFFIGILCFFVVLGALGVAQSQVLTWMLYTAPLWLPYVTFMLLFDKWTTWVGLKFAWEGNRRILRVILPPEVLKTPEAMEYFFNQVFASGAADNLWQVYIDGKRPPIMSCEIVSRGGDINFYITVPKKQIQGIKDNLYAQYPGVSLTEEAYDYTAEVPPDLKDWSFLSFHMNKKKDSHKPLKTYVDFGLDKVAKEEEKVDPITPLLEVIGSIKPGEQLWVQFLMKAHRDYSFKSGSLTAKPDWTEAAKAEIDTMMNRVGKSDEKSEDDFPRLTPGERNTVENIERNTSKYAYDVAIRWCYVVSPEGEFDASNIGKVLRALAQTEAKGGNGIGMKWRTDFNYHWFSDPFGKKLPELMKGELKDYKLRTLNPKNTSMGFATYSTEEMATLFHLPGTVALTPTLNRVISTRAEAPNNLPTG